MKKNRYGELILKDAFYGEFDGRSCGGKANLVHPANDDLNRGKAMLKEEIKTVTFTGMNKVVMDVDDDGGLTLYRVQAHNFPKYNYTNPINLD